MYIVSCAHTMLIYVGELPCVGMHAALFVPSACIFFAHFRSGSYIRNFAGIRLGASLKIDVGDRDEEEKFVASLKRIC